MISVFDKAKLKELLKDFYEITKIRITVFDENRTELLSYPETIPAFCQTVRSAASGRLKCEDCDRRACETAARTRRTEIYRCHAGLTEAVTPILTDGVLAGFLLFGHVFSYPTYEEGWAVIRKACEDLPVSQEALREEMESLPLRDQDFVRAATHILRTVASYLVMERMTVLKEDLLSVQLENYISAHYTEGLTAEEICGRFGIGRTQLYKIANGLYGCGIAEHIRGLRIGKAKELLLAGSAPLARIAEACGYPDYNYFITVFSRVTGTTPAAWRKRNGRN